MNFQTTKFIPPIRVMVINPLIPASQLTITKILSGVVFGQTQFIDLILLVYANETNQAQELAQEYTACAFPYLNTIRITSDIPCLSDADVFCFMTNFANPNCFDFGNMDSTEQFDNLYLIIKIATSFAKTLPASKESRDSSLKIKSKELKEPAKKPRKPIIVGDGLLVIDILMIIANKIPPEIMFSATPLRSIAKSTLSDFLKVKSSDINIAYVWAANDIVFYTEIGVPYLKDDIIVNTNKRCDWNAISNEMLEKLNMEHINFNASWMKKDFIKKMVQASSTNPYGCIFKSAEMAKTLHGIWMPRCIDHATDSKISLGVISDGSLGTIKGLPYVLPLIITEHSWSVDQIYEETSHLRHEIKRINVAVREHHQKVSVQLEEVDKKQKKDYNPIKFMFRTISYQSSLMTTCGLKVLISGSLFISELVPYCKKFLQDNVIEKIFIPISQDSETESSYSSLDVTPSTARTADD